MRLIFFLPPKPLAPVAQLVTAKPFDGYVLDSNVGKVAQSGPDPHTMPDNGEQLRRGCTKFDLAVDEEEKPLYPSRDIIGQAPREEYGVLKHKRNTPGLAFLLCSPD